MLEHLDKNGAKLKVGDIVRYGDAEGEVRILEDWRHYRIKPDAGVYVSGIGYWGDSKAVAACKVEKVEAQAEPVTFETCRSCGLRHDEAIDCPSCLPDDIAAQTPHAPLSEWGVVFRHCDRGYTVPEKVDAPNVHEAIILGTEKLVSEGYDDTNFDIVSVRQLRNYFPPSLEA